MAFVMRVRLPSTELPDIPALLAAAQDRLDLEVAVEEDAQRLEEAGERESSWCPWPRSRVSFYVPRASTRGVDVSLDPAGDDVDARITAPVLGTWTDWLLSVALARVLAEAGDGGIAVAGEGRFLGDGLEDMFVRSEERYLTEAVAGCDRLRGSVEAGRTVRVGGPAGFASIGPRAWVALQDGPEAELPLRLIDAIQASVEARGFEEFYPANILCLDGRDGREILASVLPPERDTLLRDPEYVLVSPDLEGDGDVPLLVLPFEHIDDALPGLPHWIDERACAVPAIPKASWAARIEAMRPLLMPLQELLDGPEPPAPPGPKPRRRWWRFW
jgi:hypothetical protein